jgi:ABC-type dipeptide/oligopeptide/nickel transport system ATPase component
MTHALLERRDEHTRIPLLEVEDLQVKFFSPRGTVHAVNQVSFTLERGERMAIVGESGSGKSVMTMSLAPPGRPSRPDRRRDA